MPSVRSNLTKIFYCLGALCIMAIGVSSGACQEVRWIVSAETGERLSPRPALHFEPGIASGTNIFNINEKVTFQTMAGFGASFLEAGLVCLDTLPPEGQERVLRSLFDPVEGAGFTAMKTPIAGTDFMSAGPYYTYDETPGDSAMRDFSIARDLGTNGVITFIKRARRYGSFVLQAPMDYPPDWMLYDVQTNQNVNPKYYDALALYYLRFLQEYEKQGIFIDYLSLFNEPGVYTKIPYGEIKVLFDKHVEPLLARSGVRTRLMLAEPPCRECAWNEFSALLDLETRRHLGALAFHGYNFDKFDSLLKLHAAFPELPLWMTEVCHATLAGTYKPMKLPRYDFEDGDFWGNQIFSDMESGVSAWIYWNMILDENGGPWTISNAHSDPDKNVQHPLVIINRHSHEVTYTGAYFYLAHFSKFVRPGSVRVAVAGAARDVRCVAFKNRGACIAELLNCGHAPATVRLEFKGRLVPLTLPPLSISSCLWNFTPAAGIPSQK
jgi:glucosylceramidase